MTSSAGLNYVITTTHKAFPSHHYKGGERREGEEEGVRERKGEERGRSEEGRGKGGEKGVRVGKVREKVGEKREKIVIEKRGR